MMVRLLVLMLAAASVGQASVSSSRQTLHPRAAPPPSLPPCPLAPCPLVGMLRGDHAAAGAGRTPGVSAGVPETAFVCVGGGSGLAVGGSRMWGLRGKAAACGQQSLVGRRHGGDGGARGGRGRAPAGALRCQYGDPDDEGYNGDEEASSSQRVPLWKRPYLFIKRPRDRFKRETMATNRAPKNSRTTQCACGSERMYANCCEFHHLKGEAPTDPVDLIRARYSAFAYRMPGYLMRTTDAQGPEFNRDAFKWEQELLKFSDQYKFKRLSGDVLGIEFQECTYSGPDVAYVQFRAYMLGPGQTPVEILERSKLTRYQGKWLYSTGTLVEWDGPLM